ncbi:T9SS type A sorting domain-containing protein [Paenimyroides aestuarii]|uniref:T9SS type A sorting domain-containing protein n=1 Tax=Paenimyroides aestuarii TaxID=2968490 RepID=A0ABY5NTP9_9FLAO|nr:T9SS type A sorting domain-containing protein [Paenimyroides aestuarii]UUV21842.1 T9SS type A sorting domain-containing protein [Paenimyroides aestuarii]
MKKKIFVILLGISVNGVSSQTLEFTYDAAGNQIQRELVTLTVNSVMSTNSVETEKEEDTMLPKSNSLNENSTAIEFYPNPVVDLLNVEWKSSLQITQIILFDGTGKMLQLKKVNEGTTIETFNLSTYSSGTYYIRLFDAFQQSKSYKIIKK